MASDVVRHARFRKTGIAGLDLGRERPIREEHRRMLVARRLEHHGDAAGHEGL